jgi:hypothetical protein
MESVNKRFGKGRESRLSGLVGERYGDISTTAPDDNLEAC